MKTQEKEVKQILKRIKTGAPLSWSDAEILENHIKRLEHHKETTVGLYATDRLEFIVDDKKLMHQISFES